MSFPDSSICKEFTCNGGNPSSIPRSGYGEGIGYPLQYSCASLVVQLVKICLQCGRPGFDPWIGKILWRGEGLPTPVFWPGEFHGLYSHGLAKSQSDFHFHQISAQILYCDYINLWVNLWRSNILTMALHSSTVARKIPWMEEPGRLQSMGSLESDTTERLHFHFPLSCIGEGNGNPLQCSCLENPRDGGAWQAAVHGVSQSWTRLKRLSNILTIHSKTNEQKHKKKTKPTFIIKRKKL